MKKSEVSAARRNSKKNKPGRLARANPMNDNKMTLDQSAGPDNDEGEAITADVHHVLCRYADVRQKIRNGDVLLFRPQGPIWRLVARGGRSQYSHAAMSAWWNTHLMCVEMTDSGGRAQLLSNLIDKWPGTIDVFGVVAGRRYRRRQAVKAMIEITGVDYGWWNLFRAALAHSILLRSFVSPQFEDEDTCSRPPFCSQAVSQAMRQGGIDPVPQLADRLTEPGDLARSAALEYRFTLI